MSDRAVTLCEHVSPFSPFPDDHLGALVRRIAAAVAGRMADTMGLLAAAVGDKRGQDLFTLQWTVFMHWMLRFCYLSCHCPLSSVISCMYICIITAGSQLFGPGLNRFENVLK